MSGPEIPAQTGAYERRVLRVLEYIHENPAGDLSLDRLAEVAAMSRFHWHRVFYAMTGETCAEAVRRVRLHRAACWLVQTDWPVAEIARKAGYAGTPGFSRAFSVAYGHSPASFRRRGDLIPPLSRKPKGERPMFPVTVETRDPMRLAALSHTGPYIEIGSAFERVGALFTSRGLWPQARGMAGLYHDAPGSKPEADLQSEAGVIVGDEMEIADPMHEVQVPGGRYAVLHFKGPYAGLRAAYDYLYGDWLPTSEEEPADSPPVEVYLNSPADTAPDELLTEIRVPLK